MKESLMNPQQMCDAYDTLVYKTIVYRSILAELPKQERRRYAEDAMRDLYGLADDDESGTGLYAALAGQPCERQEDPEALGRRIMEERNVNYKDRR